MGVEYASRAFLVKDIGSIPKAALGEFTKLSVNPRASLVRLPLFVNNGHWSSFQPQNLIGIVLEMGGQRDEVPVL